MSAYWDNALIQWAILAAVLVLAGAVYPFLRRKPSEDRLELFDKAERWVYGVFAVLLVGSLAFVTFRYS